MRFPSTLLEFQTQFPDDDHCWAYLRRARWPRGFLCPRCGGRGSHFLASRRLEQCRACRYQSSVTAGTVFHGTRVSLRVWFLGIFFLARHKKGISALQFQKDTGLGSYQTAWTLLHKLRSGLATLPAPLAERRRRGRRDLHRRVSRGLEWPRGGQGGGRHHRRAASSYRRLCSPRRHAPRNERAVLVPFVEGAIRATGNHRPYRRLDFLQGTRQAGDRPSGSQSRTRAPEAGRASVGPHHLRKPQDVATRNLPRGQPEAPSALLARVRVPLQPTLARRTSSPPAFCSARSPRAPPPITV